MWIAKSVTMNDSVHVRSIGARVRSASLDLCQPSRSHAGSSRQSELAHDCFIGLGVVYTEATTMFQAMPKIRSAPAIATAPREKPPLGQQNQQDNGEVAEAANPAIVRSFPYAASSEAERVTDGIDRKPARNDDSQSRAGKQRRVDQGERNDHADEGTHRGLSPSFHRRAPQSMQSLDAGGDPESQPTRAVGDSASLKGVASARAPVPG